MTADATLTHELRSLHRTLAGSHQKRRPRPADGDAAANKTDRRRKRSGENGLHAEIARFIELMADRLEEAKENASIHPAISIVGAVVVGTLIGRLLARRRELRHGRRSR